MNALVEASELSFQFGSGRTTQKILTDVSLTVHAGEIVLLTGPSGSGKTTLLTLMGCLRGIQTGSMTVVGSDLTHASDRDRRAVRRQIGFIFQQHNLLKFLTAVENVQLAVDLESDDGRRGSAAPTTGILCVGRSPTVGTALLRRPSGVQALEALAAVGMEDRATHLPSQLSGGQCQRVAIARALARSPKLILADEPTASLDKENSERVASLLRNQAHTNGAAVVLVTHDPRVRTIADRVVQMQDGRIETGTRTL